jgi:Ni/Fe-hydrogenase subunit HybB-like protein
MATMTDTAPATARGNHFLLHLVVALLLLAIGGGYVLSEIAQFGKVQFNTSNAGIHWGMAIVTYDYFLLTSTGLAMVASLWHVFGLKEFEPIARRALWLAMAGLVGGVAVLFLELGAPLTALWATPLNMQTASPLFWKVLAGGCLYDHARDGSSGHDQQARAERNPLMIAVGVLALAVTLVAGSVYGMMAMRPVWFGGEIPVVFLIESFMGALAFTVFFSHLKNGFNHDNMRPETRSLFEGTWRGCSPSPSRCTSSCMPDAQ